jgi:ring-1,2-phenylacetyl-CoA epoxidase subunit PaaC
MTQQEALFKYTLRLGDTSLILGQRLSEWCGNGPIMEEDIALANIALDYMGQAIALLKYAGETEGKGRDEDALAYFRTERQYFNRLIVEQPNGDFGATIARQFLFTAFARPFYTALSGSKDVILAGVAQKAVKETSYHLRHSTEWVLRLGDGTEESNARLQEGIDDLWGYTGELFEMEEADQLLIKEGIAVDLAPLHKEWLATVKETTAKAGIKIPENNYMHKGSKDGQHTEHLGHILAEMQYLPRAFPTAKW